MKQKQSLILSLFSFFAALFLFVGMWFAFSHTPSFADDDDEEHEEEDDEDEDDDDHEEDERKSTETDSQKTTAPKTTTTTATTNKTTTTIVKDGDGDGLLDSDDPHPSIPEFLIVKDENRNGIVDTFESSVSP